MKVKLSIRRPYGEILLEGDTLEDLVNHLKSVPEWLSIVDGLIRKTETPTSKKDFLQGIVEFTSDGIAIAVPKDRLSDKEAICLLLYANDPSPMQPREIARLLTISGRLSAGFGARVSELRNEALILKEGTAYRLTATGKQWTESLLERLKA